jgi:hypothetical protein
MTEDTGTVGISFADLTNIAESLRSLVQQLRSSLNTTQGIINSSVGSDEVWNSDAARKYRSQFTSFANTFDDFEMALKKCATFLDETVVAAYKKADMQMNEAAASGLTTGTE